ncbi:hypothetical protein GPY51_24330 [Photorhabdus laumondii subsp. laumondii]|uniref:Uncharacterized protein n=1 Tax=Photorhabdus laumondii subsp. laumondii TaxID=141679 RepID=A0A6L9JV59_PHOLM|nr:MULTISPECIES: hypothetical protein [Photorhabdus]AXG42195.1 hypothetical protein PluDJC_07965 [Photorhabdus laumondii subsp. laumondii]MCC8386539.1 hypothetical protein [Photorhabdus laumondii]MCC8389251.1 hypothetical protein [Photorhabdus laumondii]MCC8415691.1 hypothetical protein [Photorhabdus laumondii]MCZ1250591.1 hypothetical protein [Photorhabdus laumondii subsp. laumondii]
MSGENRSSFGGDIVSAFFNASLAFYDKNPVIASIGYLLLTGSVPLYLLLRFAAKIKQLDNTKVIEKFKLEVGGRNSTDNKPTSTVVNSSQTGG